MRKFIIAAAAAFAIATLPGSSAFASPPGAYEQPGYDVASEHSDCVDHGSFGYFGAQGETHDMGTVLGSNGRPGASNWKFPNTTTGATTGGNNSSLCGNGAEPAPFDTL